VITTDRTRRLVQRLLGDQETYAGSVGADMRQLWRDYLSRQKWPLLAAFAVTMVWSGHAYGMALIARFLVDSVLLVQEGFAPEQLPERLLQLRVYVLLLVGLWTVFSVTNWTRSWLIITLGRRLVYLFRKQLHEKLQALHIAYFEQIETGKLMSRVLDDVSVIQRWATNGVLSTMAYAFRIVLGIGIVFALNWRLALVVLVSLPLYAFIFSRIHPKVMQANRAVRRLNAEMYGVADERISGIAVVKAFSQEGRERRTFARLMDNLVRLSVESTLYGAGQGSFTGIITAVATGVVILLSSLSVRAGTMTLGDVMVFIYALPNLFAQIEGMSAAIAQVQGVLVVLRRVFSLLSVEEEVIPGSVKLDGMVGKISFENVSFHYPGQSEPALADISFDIAPGEQVALMGPSGAGKSTIFQLLSRFYDPQQGAVRVGGVSLVEADSRSIHEHIRLVQQEPVIFSGTIAENIAFGRMDSSPASIMRAAKQAELHEFVMSLPVKYETEVGQQGVTLSGGQKQRLALATALLTDPEVLLLDDTTSALDAATEHRIRTTLDQVLSGRTSLIITQRIATARSCDRIIVLDAGRVSQQGTHDQLVGEAGFYRRIFEQQDQL
jgi:ABC-type multidrug transport system fused ATPase/permease subunit